MKLTPIKIHNHDVAQVLKGLLSHKADRDVVTERSYVTLVTRFGVGPEQARQLLKRS